MNQRRMSVSIFGNSVALLVAGERGTERPYHNYASFLRELEVDGVGFEVAGHAKIRGEIAGFMDAWAPLCNERPDVVVLQFGSTESLSLLMSPKLNAYLLGWTRRGGPIRARYWGAAKRALVQLHHLERRVDEHLPVTWCRSSPRQYEADLRGLVEQIHRQVGSRVVLMDLLPFDPEVRFVSSHSLERQQMMSEVQHRVAAELGAEVFPMAEVIADWDPAMAVPDGLHLGVEAHRAVGQALAEWLVHGPGPVKPAAVPLD